MNNISVALCTYNGEQYLAEQLNSILSQTYKVNEIIICDDCSTDTTIQIIKNYQEQHPNLIQLHQNKIRLGSTKNFEKAINLCTYELIFLCDQDDIWLPKKVEIINQTFVENPNKSAIFHNLFLYKNQQVLPLTIWEVLGFNPNNNISLFDFLLIFGNVVTGMALAIRKPNSPIFFSEKRERYFLHDYLLAVEYASKKQLLPVNKCLGYYRKHFKQQVGFKEHKTSQNYYEKTYNNPFCLYLHLQKRINYLQKYKSVHHKMPQFIELLNEKKKELPSSFSVSQFPFFIKWIISKTVYKIVNQF